MKRNIFFFLALLLIGFIGGLYQNCAKVPLETPSIQEKLEFIHGKMTLCLDGPYANDTIESTMVLNLNLVNKGHDVVVDTDGDGLSDDDERTYGFNPKKRRTDGKYLDKICLGITGTNDCSGTSVGCSSVPNKLGLSDCDYMVLGLDLLYGHPNQGLDSDKDGMVDLAEIVRGTFPNQSDALSDPDHDLVRNIDEISRGSNVVVHDEPFDSKFKVSSSADKNLSDPSCLGGESWTLNVDNLPWAPVEAFTDDLQSSLSADSLSYTRPSDTNTGVIIVKLHPRLGQSGNAKILIRPLILGRNTGNLSGTINDFFSAGEVEP